MDRDARKKVRALERKLQRKEKALAETTALLTLSKKALPAAGRPGDLGVGRGRMISAPDRRLAVSLIDEARTAGARLKPSCGVLGITARNLATLDSRRCCVR